MYVKTVFFKYTFDTDKKRERTLWEIMFKLACQKTHRPYLIFKSVNYHAPACTHNYVVCVLKKKKYSWKSYITTVLTNWVLSYLKCQCLCSSCLSRRI